MIAFRLVKKVILAMRLIVLWREMYEFCMSREGHCNDCPYNEKGICTKVSTEKVMRYSADVFDEFLESELPIS